VPAARRRDTRRARRCRRARARCGVRVNTALVCVVDGGELDEFERLGSARCDDFDFVAFFLVQDRASDRRRRRNHALLRVGVFRHHELIDEHRAVSFAKMDCRPETGAVARNPIEIHQLDFAHPLLQHRDPGIDNALTFLGRFVLRVFTQVTVLARALDFLRQIDFQFALERRDFIGKSLENAVLHDETDFNIPVSGWSLVVGGWSLVVMKRIATRHNAIVRAYRQLARQPDAAGLRLLLDGAHLVREAHAAALRFESVVIAQSHLDRATEEALLAHSLHRAGVDVMTAGEQVFAAISPVRTPSGIVAIVHRHLTTLSAILTQARLFVLVVVDVQDPGNLGSLARVAEAGGVTGLIVTGDSANPFAWKAVRGSMGSVLRLPIARSPSIDAVMQEIAQAKAKMVAAVPRDGLDPDAVDWSGRVALLLGGEGPGLNARLVAASEDRVTIPMESPVESLNVAASAAIIIYAARRARR
jgi:TrmH family RNA methyltransferase